MRIVCRLMVAAVLGSGGAAVTVSPATAAAPGEVLSSSAAALPPELAPLATARRVTYATTDVHGTVTPTTGLVLTPRVPQRSRTVVWGHGTTGLADRCAPSTDDAVFWPEARAAVAELLRRGWTVTAPDYPGLGTAEPHPYLIGVSEARSMIDSVRAARALDPNLSVHYAVAGHSQGGQGALFANQIAPGYDGNLMLRGTASIAPVSGIRLLAELIPGTPGQGYLVMGLSGLAAVEPGFDPLTVLAPAAEAKLPVLQSGCLPEILAAYAELSADQLLTGGTLPETWVAALERYDEPAQTRPTTPVMIVQGTADQDVPQFLTDALRQRLAGQGAQVTYLQIEGGTHDSTVTSSAVAVADWLGQRLR